MVNTWLMQQEAASSTFTTTVLPPRPNPGPELPPAPRGWGLGLGLVAGGIGLLGVGWLLRWFLGHRGPALIMAPRAVDLEPESIVSPVVRAAESARALLVERLGPDWIALTTEEMQVRPELRDWLGAERALQLLDLFASADHLKFAPHDPSETSGGEATQRDWSAWLEGLRAASLAGASSTSTGRWSEPIGGPSRRSVTASSGEGKT